MHEDEGFIAFKCDCCQAEIEASEDMIGEATECPACGQKITVPAPKGDDARRHGEGEKSAAMIAAEKSRTIRIELGGF